MGYAPSVERTVASDDTQIATLYLASRAAALPWLRRVHSDDEVGRWLTTVLLPRCETWVARLDGRIVGFLALSGEEVEQFYLLPGFERRGIGSLLLARAKERSPQRLSLFTFQRNAPARAFYEARGFAVVDLNDGSRNEEGEPDVLYRWQGEMNS